MPITRIVEMRNPILRIVWPVIVSSRVVSDVPLSAPAAKAESACSPVGSRRLAGLPAI